MRKSLSFIDMQTFIFLNKFRHPRLGAIYIRNTPANAKLFWFPTLTPKACSFMCAKKPPGQE
jgi:hypothetical protein